MEEDYTAELPKIVKGTGINLLGAVSRTLFGFIFVFILARFLDTTELGLFYLGISVTMLLKRVKRRLDAFLIMFLSLA
jgi:O-antigen/teichoic acid export membrane protein